MYYDDIDQYVDRFYREREEARQPRALGDFSPAELRRAWDMLDQAYYPGARDDPAAVRLMAQVLRNLGW
jgi:hypothetical protein